MLFEKLYCDPVKLTCLIALFLPVVVSAKSLEQLIATALSTHPSVKSGMAMSGAAQHDIERARWQFYPTPSFELRVASTSNEDASFKGDDAVAVVGLTQPLWAGGRLTAGLDKAHANAAMEQARVNQIQREVTLGLIQSYANWFSAYRRAEVWRESLETHEHLMKQVRRRVDAGVSARSDLQLVEGRLQLTLSELLTSQVMEETELSRLGQFVGDELDSVSLALNLPEPRKINEPLGELVMQAQALDPAVKKAQFQLDVAGAETREREADLWPQVSLRLEYQYGNLSVPDTDPETRLFINFRSQFGAGFSSFSNVKQARSRRGAAQAEVNVQRRVAREQVESDYKLVRIAAARVTALQSSVNTSKSVYESYGRQFLAGRKTWLDLMNAVRDQAQTEIQLADVEAARIVASWRLTINTQGLSFIEEAQL